MKNPQKIAAVAATIAVAVLLSAESCSVEEQGTTSDQAVTEDIMTAFAKSQPVPVFPYSQERENVIDILTARASAIPTTSFAMHNGSPDPIHICSSIGFAIPHTTQLTSPDQVVDRYEGDVVIAQAEPVGTFTGDTDATHVICVDANGRAYDDYWEGDVNTVTGPAEWNYELHRIELIGAPTGEFSTGK